MKTIRTNNHIEPPLDAEVNECSLASSNQTRAAVGEDPENKLSKTTNKLVVKANKGT